MSTEPLLAEPIQAEGAAPTPRRLNVDTAHICVAALFGVGVFFAVASYPALGPALALCVMAWQVGLSALWLVFGRTATLTRIGVVAGLLVCWPLLATGVVVGPAFTVGGGVFLASVVGSLSLLLAVCGFRVVPIDLQARQSATARLQFSLATLLRIIAAFAFTLAVWRIWQSVAPRRDVAQAAMFIVNQAILTLLAVWLVLGTGIAGTSRFGVATGYIWIVSALLAVMGDWAAIFMPIWDVLQIALMSGTLLPLRSAGYRLMRSPVAASPPPDNESSESAADADESSPMPTHKGA